MTVKTSATFLITSSLSSIRIRVYGFLNGQISSIIKEVMAAKRHQCPAKNNEISHVHESAHLGAADAMPMSLSNYKQSIDH